MVQSLHTVCVQCNHTCAVKHSKMIQCYTTIHTHYMINVCGALYMHKYLTDFILLSVVVIVGFFPSRFYFVFFSPHICTDGYTLVLHAHKIKIHTITRTFCFELDQFVIAGTKHHSFLCCFSPIFHPFLASYPPLFLSASFPHSNTPICIVMQSKRTRV